MVGLPGALGKGAAVPLPYIGGDLARSVRDSNQLSYNIAATVVSGLSQVLHQPMRSAISLQSRCFHLWKAHGA